VRSKKLTLLVALFLALATSLTVNLMTVTPASADGCYTWTRNLSQGSSGGDVAQLQIRIAGWVAYGENLAIDGAFGGATANALKRFQSSYGLVADGIAGSNTYNVIYSIQDDDCTPIHFSHSEFNYSCGEGDYTGGAVDATTARENMKRIMWQLEALRRKLGSQPLVVTSGFRSYSCNSSVNGSPSSLHLYGQAADLGTGSGPSLCTMAGAGRNAGFEEILGPGYPNHNDHAHLGNKSGIYWSAPNCGI
jgi:zinc D-Ala-D-Ala carboxypeptidase